MDRLYWIAGTITICLCVLLCLARKEIPAEGTASLLKPFYKIALYLYKKICRCIPKTFSSPQVEKDLLQLYPGESSECLKTEYYVKKAAVCLAVVFGGTFIGVIARFNAESGIILNEDGSIIREGYEGRNKEAWLAVDYGQEQMDFQVEVEPLLLSGSQAVALVEAFIEELPRYIVGKNESLEKVSYDLVLEKKYTGSPVAVEWKSDKPGVLSDDGQIFSLDEKQEVILTAKVSYGECVMEAEFPVTLVLPEMTAKERDYQELKELLEHSQKESVTEERWKLPDEWQGRSVAWRQIVEDKSLHLWSAAMAAAVVVFFVLDRDLHEQLEKRKKGLRREYPEIVHKLALYVGAGMTVRGAFQKIAGDYEAKRRDGGRKSPAYDEIVYTCRELYSGISEGIAYEHFGRRTGLQEYIRLTALLAQNLKRGNSTLLERLREEADKSAEERLQQSKKLGEEAGTKLLVPMVLMLAVVMAVIMIPALSNM